MPFGLSDFVQRPRRAFSDPGPILRYGVAVLAVLVATVLRLALNLVLGVHGPYLPFALAVMFAARFGGRWPGLFATALSMLSVTWFFLKPIHSFRIADPAAGWGLALAFVTAVLISLMVGDLRESHQSTARAEESLRDSEAQFRTLADAIPQLCWMADADGEIFWYNERTYEHSGATLEQLKGWGWQSFLGPEVRTGVVKRWQHSLATGEPFDMVFPLRGADGSFRPFLTRIMPVRDRDGRVVRWFGTATDITEQRNTEEALRHSRDHEAERAAELQAIMDAMPVAVLIARDVECRHIIGNRKAYDLFRLPPGSNLSKSAPEGEVPSTYRVTRFQKEVPPHELPVQKAAATGLPVPEYEFDLGFEDGTSNDMIGFAVPLLDAEGRSRGAVGVFADITDRKRSEERLRQMQKLESIGLLAGGVAHDFNNLLTVIMGGVSSVFAEHPECEQLNDVIAASERAAYLTRQLLAYSGKGQFFVSTFDLNDLVPRSAQLVSASIPKRVKLVFNLAPEELLIKADPSQIEQILMNLVINAGEAVPPQTNGRVEITTSVCDVTPAAAQRHSQTFDIQPGRFVCLEVTDNGVGMDEATVSQIFDPFFSTKFTGRGLGLAAVHGIVHSAKGFIEVLSAPGEGSTFRVHLPAAVEPRAAGRPAGTQAGASRHQGGASGAILVVDDEELVRKLASLTLRRRGFDVLEAKGGQEALEVLAAAAPPPSLALVDLTMGGDDLVPILNQRYPGLKIIVTSGYPEEDTRKGFPAKSVAGFLQKPYTIMSLSDKVDEILGTRVA